MHKIKESIVKKALKSLDSKPLCEHLDTTSRSPDILVSLLGYILRENGFIHKYPNPPQEIKCQQFFSELAEYLRHSFNEDAANQLVELTERLKRIEQKYRDILDQLAASRFSTLSPDVQVSASIQRAEQQFHIYIQRHEDTFKAKKDYLTFDGTVEEKDGVPISIGQISNMIVQSLSSTLIMQGFQNKWFDAKKALVLPALPKTGEPEQYMAGSSEVLSFMWHQWRSTEERARFLGGTLEEATLADFPSEMPAGIERLIVYRPQDDEFYDFAANQRERERLASTYRDLAFLSDMEEKVVGIDTPAALPPTAFISEDEIYTVVSLCGILSYQIASDNGIFGGLRFVEWVRGFATLKELAKKQEEANKSDPSKVLVGVSKAYLISILESLGLKDGKADLFCDLTTLKSSSRDLFDAPLIKLSDGSLLLFAPALVAADLPQVVLSVIGNLGLQIKRKGHSFEDYVLNFFRKHGFRAEKLTVHRGKEEYQFDVLVPWDKYLFLFECKHNGLSNDNPINAYHFRLGVEAAARQTNRLVDALKRYPEILTDNLKERADLKIVPCVLNAFTYSRFDTLNNVYFYDSSALTRFFEKPTLGFVSIQKTENGPDVIHEIPIKSLWSGDKPTPDDFLKELKTPSQLELILHHCVSSSHSFRIPKKGIVFPNIFMSLNMTPESVSKAMRIPSGIIQDKILSVSKLLKEIKIKNTPATSEEGKQK